MLLDYRVYVVNINLDEYFNIKHFDIDKIHNSKLNSRRSIYKKVFQEIIKEHITLIHLYKTIVNHCNIHIKDEMLKYIDYEIIYILNKARKAVEGL